MPISTFAAMHLVKKNKNKTNKIIIKTFLGSSVSDGISHVCVSFFILFLRI